ncbi:MAG: hypothetical protein V8R80_12875 [Eubacterium sp.]
MHWRGNRDDPEIACVLANNEHAIYQAGHLIRCGHDQIGILLGHEDVSTRDERLNGYLRAMRENHSRGKFPLYL